MKITSLNVSPKFGANDNIGKEKTEQTQNDILSKEHASNKKDAKYIDPLTTWPVRGLGYTNDIGIAINELAPNAARLFWVPALMYFGADIYDKYKNKGDTYKPNGDRAFSEAVFQACASILFPAISGTLGMSAFSFLDKFKGDKLTTNAKEQTLRYIKSHVDSYDNFSDIANRINMSEDFISDFGKHQTAMKADYADKNIIAKAWDALMKGSKKGAIPRADDEKLKLYARAQFEKILSKCTDANDAKKVLDKKIFKLKAWKSAGAFTAILLTAKAVDDFVERIVIKRFVEPQIKKFHQQRIKMDDFGKPKPIKED